MIRIESQCRECAVPGYPCLGSSCRFNSVEVHYCDECGCELDKIYLASGEEFCEDCYKEEINKKGALI